MAAMSQFVWRGPGAAMLSEGDLFTQAAQRQPNALLVMPWTLPERPEEPTAADLAKRHDREMLRGYALPLHLPQGRKNKWAVA